eukprot:4145642-Amphidinium_carterae.1
MGCAFASLPKCLSTFFGNTCVSVSPKLVGFQSRRSLLPLILLVLLWKIPLLALGRCPKTRCRSSLDTASTTVQQGILAVPVCMPTIHPMYEKRDIV